MTRQPVSPFATKRLKHVVLLRRTHVDGSGGGRPYIGLENIASWTGKLLCTSPSDDRPSASAQGISHGNTFEPGDVLFGKLRPYLAKAWVAEFPGRSTTEFLVMRPVDVEPRFLRYVFLWRYFVEEVDASTAGSRMPRAEWDLVGNIPVPVPELSMQSVIANYLDRETARLDALVATKERVLALLSEKRRALITRTVTCGLDPDATLRDSGIPWLGASPAHWEIWKLGHSASVGNGSTPNRGNGAYWTDGTIPWLNSSVVNETEAKKADQFVTDLALRECHLPLVRSGSVLVAITGQGKTRGQAVVLSFNATINQHLAYISPDHSRLDPWFLRWTLFSAYGFLRSISDDTGGTKGALTCEDIASVRVPIPPIDEQRAIVAHIANETSKLDELRTATERTMALLKERRAALIAGAVTGRIDIRATS